MKVSSVIEAQLKDYAQLAPKHERALIHQALINVRSQMMAMQRRMTLLECNHAAAFFEVESRKYDDLIKLWKPDGLNH